MQLEFKLLKVLKLEDLQRQNTNCYSDVRQSDTSYI